MTIYFAASNFDVAISCDKSKVRRFAKRSLRFAGVDLQIGVYNKQLLNPEAYKAEFGPCSLYDLDQRLVFRPDFSVARTM